MKLVGEALKNNYQIQKKDEIKLLGIAYWNTLKDKETLLKVEKNPVRFYFRLLKDDPFHISSTASELMLWDELKI